MTYYSRYRDIQFTAISEVGLTGGSGESFSVGDSFTYSGADATINVRDNDSFLAGDSYRNERGNDYQAGTIETENGTINAGNVYAESFYILYGSDGRVYFLAEIEGTGLSNDLSQDDYFTFIGHVPPAGVELTAVAQKNVFGGIRYSSLGAGDIADAGIPGQAVDDEFTVSEESDGTSITFNLLDNDVLGSASSLEVTAVDGMAVGGGTAIDLADGGSVLVGGDGSVQFDADGDFEALGAGETQIVSFNYAVTDSDGNTSAATAFITVTGSNDGPTLAAGNIDVVEGGVTISLDLAALGNDIDNDDDGTTLTYSISGQPSEGVASISGTTLNFDPINDFQDLADGETRDVILQITATDRHGATATNDVTVTVTGTNDAPTVNSPVNFGSIPEDGLIVIEQGELIDGSSDVDGDALSVTNVTSSDGTLTDDGFGGVIFNAAPNFNGLATIDVEISDGIETVIRQITVNVIPQNDAPTVNGPLDLGAIDEDTSRTITFVELLGNVTDVDGNTLGLNSVTSTSGTVTSDGSGNFIFSPEANDDTEVTITYVVSDGIASVTGTATLDLTAVNDDPVVASALMATATEDDEVFSVDLLDGASDVDTGDVLSISNLVVLSGDVSGVTVNGTVIEVDPSAYDGLTLGESEVIEYSYSVMDGNGGSAAQTATITINGTNNFTGTDQDNTLVGDAVDNVILGLGGDDTLTGNEGADTLDGGDGSDTVDYSAETGTEGVIVDLGGTSSNDPPFAQDTYGDRDRLLNIENLIATDNNDSVTGNDSDNRVELRDGFDRYSYEVDGSNDIVDGGAGVDRLFIVNGERFGILSAGNFSTTATTFNVSVLDSASDTINSSASATDTDDILITVNTGGSITADAFGGYSFQLGAAGDTVNIVGDFSNTALFGGAGSQVIYGGAGNDIVDASMMFGFTGGISGVAVAFLANGGDDTFRSGAGDDTFNGNAAAFSGAVTGFETNGDTADYTHATASVFINLGNDDNVLVDARSADATAAGLGDDTLIDVENAIGGSDDDAIFGSAEGNTLDGGGGNDIIAGGVGSDRLIGGTGEDTFVFAQGDEADVIVDFEDGIDLVELQQFGLDANGIDAVIADGTMNGNSLELDFGNGDTLIFENIDASILSSDDFILN